MDYRQSYLFIKHCGLYVKRKKRYKEFRRQKSNEAKLRILNLRNWPIKNVELFEQMNCDYEIIVETSRTIIREFTTNDIDSAYKIYSDIDVMKFIGDGKGFTIEQTKDFIEKMIVRYNQHGYSFWAVEDKINKNLIGHCGVMFDHRTGKNEIGYTIRKEFWRQGLALETSKSVVDYAFAKLQLNELVSFTKLINVPSQEMMKKLKMTLWKTYIKNNIDYVAYSVNREKYY